MTLRIILLFALFFPKVFYAQTVITSEMISIDFDRALHFVLSNTVEYVSTGSKYIEAEIIPESPNIVRVIAMEENFTAATNLTIISKSGEIYTYGIFYKAKINDPSVFYPDSATEAKKATVQVNTQNVAHIIFPGKIIYFREGNDQAFSAEKTSAGNIIKIAPLKELSSEDYSNLFCVDEKGICYNVAVVVDYALSYVYNLSDESESVAKVNMNEETVETICKKAIEAKRNIINKGFKKNKFEFSLNNLFIRNELFYFVFEIKNSSNINLDIDFIKCFLIDQKELRDAVQQETVINNKYEYNLKTQIKANEDHKFVLVFDKFTIPDRKVFKIEIYERGGGRHINFKIKNRVIISAINI
ncbi:MAG: conjugative transposon protein TraN [Bacteroidales bacterium]|jgi:conjugative transposon TraN protein|nr:conjugative transposon protein TraN [Bacteroidales bacterium]